MSHINPPELAIKNREQHLFTLIQINAVAEQCLWLEKRLELITKNKSARDFFLAFSLSSSTFNNSNEVIFPELTEQNKIIIQYLKEHKASLLEIVRLYILVKVLDSNAAFFTSKIIKLMETSDRTELATILKFLILLPDPAAFKLNAVDNIRTNMTGVFDAIALNNPYSAMYFDTLQWNQMYLKAAFMERPLSRILYLEERANPELTRMINDYAQERWSADREINPLFWRPTSYSMDTLALKNIKRLLQSNDMQQQYAGALCCLNSNNPEAALLLAEFPSLKKAVASGEISWKYFEKH